MRISLGLASAVVLGAAGAILGASPALATPITYTEQAIATGSLGGVAFTNAGIVLTMRNDTANVTPGPPPFSFLNTGTATVSVGGGPAAIFKDMISVFTDQGAAIAGFFDGERPGIIFAASSPSFATYDLKTFIGPISGNGLSDFSVDFATRNGPFVLFSVLRNTTTFAATASTAVPEPSSLALLGGALLGLGLLLRRRIA